MMSDTEIIIPYAISGVLLSLTIIAAVNFIRGIKRVFIDCSDININERGTTAIKSYFQENHGQMMFFLIVLGISAVLNFFKILEIFYIPDEVSMKTIYRVISSIITNSL